jgi:D-beta-D-heptose 7-phosphate kinase/D-beta-D-heptose 1-phosphate adenosyltransferase
MYSIKPQTIIVLGDIMLDVEIHGNTEKMANEAPIPVLHFNFQKKTLGGCGNVLMNLQSLGCDRLFIFSMIGNDSSGKEIQDCMAKYPEIIPKLSVSNSYTTTVKTRGFSNKKILFRYDIERRTTLSDAHVETCRRQIDEILKGTAVDSIIISDYNKGFLTKELVEYVILRANSLKIPTFVDPKKDYMKYTGCTVFKPNIKEVQDIFGISFSPEKLKEIHQKIQETVKCNETVLTLSEQGISYFKKEGELICKKESISEVCDVTGAGDVVICIIAYFYKYFDMSKLIHLATWIGTHSVKHVGTYIVKKCDIFEGLKKIRDTKVITADNFRFFDTPVLVTNGCFDIVHEGHLALFKYCRSVTPENGHVVVALNSDVSIRNLKGPTRPIHSLESRIALLNQLETIDWIVVFDEDTPYELYKAIKPDVLVKGGDYNVDDLIGREFCKEVKLFKYISGKSTTEIVQKIQDLK